MRFLLHKALLMVALVALPILVAAQGVTTASMSGQITDAGTGEGLIGATIQAVHEPSGSVFGNVGDTEGYFRISNMRVGGPYRVTVSYTGYGTIEYTGIILRLGENQVLNVNMEDASTNLSTVEVVAQIGTTGENAGASTQITSELIDNLPTLNRNIDDFVRLTPQASSFGGGLSFAGTNNRFNAIYIDGAVNNDVFGLSPQGTNGGQTGIAPFSIDIIDQFQVVLSPYDVTLGGFAGGGINAVTKSGTNEFSGTAYLFVQNDNLAGLTNTTLGDRLGEDFTPTKLDEFSQRTYGASLGGPIVKDKVFFFINAEIREDQTPNPFEFGTYNGNITQDSLGILRQFLIDNYEYDPGTFGNVTDALDGLSLFGKIDVNINENHRLTLRHNYTNAEEFSPSSSSAGNIRFSNGGVFFPSTTNSSAVELNSQFGNNASNNLIIGYTTVRDDRDPIGSPFPFVEIADGNGDIFFGSERFSTGNILDQDILSITDNFKLYKGAHTFTIGTHNEFYSIRNLFIPNNFGSYEYQSVGAFINDAGASDYDRTYSLVDGITGDGSAAAAEFNAIQLGFYAQDEWTVNNRLTLTGGVRLDIPIITTDPERVDNFEETLRTLASSYEVAGRVSAQSAPSGQLMISPRLGFTYELTEKSRLRGGVGIFTSRIPFVWPGAMFSNTGLRQGRVRGRDLEDPILFIPGIQEQYINPNFSVPSGQVDLFVDDFKYPQVLRGNLAYETTVGNGWEVTLEGIYSKTLNNIVYTNVNSDPTVDFTWTNTPDNRQIFGFNNLEEQYSAIYVADNTSEGYTYTLTASVAKQFGRNLNATLAYTWGDAYALSEGTSSQNSSGWRGQVHINGRNNPVYGRADFAIGHRVVSSVNYKLNWNSNETFSTTFSLFYNGQAGSPYSFVIDGADNVTSETGSFSRERTLVYVPASADEINLIDITDSNGDVVLSAAEQWNRLDAFISDNPHLDSRRGDYAEKNGSFRPFTSIFDFSVRQDLGLLIGESADRL
ncbi:MAG: TonB-dependent receptor, partial [Bacteroidota bacterium]